MKYLKRNKSQERHNQNVKKRIILLVVKFLVAIYFYLAISALESLAYFIKTCIQQIAFYIKIILIVKIGACAWNWEDKKQFITFSSLLLN